MLSKTTYINALIAKLLIVTISSILAVTYMLSFAVEALHNTVLAYTLIISLTITFQMLLHEAVKSFVAKVNILALITILLMGGTIATSDYLSVEHLSFLKPERHFSKGVNTKDLNTLQTELAEELAEAREKYNHRVAKAEIAYKEDKQAPTMWSVNELNRNFVTLKQELASSFDSEQKAIMTYYQPLLSTAKEKEEQATVTTDDTIKNIQYASFALIVLSLYFSLLTAKYERQKSTIKALSKPGSTIHNSSQGEEGKSISEEKQNTKVADVTLGEQTNVTTEEQEHLFPFPDYTLTRRQQKIVAKIAEDKKQSDRKTISYYANNAKEMFDFSTPSFWRHWKAIDNDLKETLVA